MDFDYSDLRASVAEDPANASLWLQYANALFTQDGDPDEAIFAHERVAALTGRDARLRLAHLYSRKGEAKVAIELAENSVEDTDSVESFEVLLDLLVSFALYDEAESVAERAIIKSPDHAPFHYFQGRAQQREHHELKGEEFSTVERSYRFAIKLDPDYVAALAKLGELLVDNARVKEGLGLLRLAIQREGDNGWLWIGLANRLWKAGLYADADVAYRRSLDTEDSNPQFERWYKEFLESSNSIDPIDPAPSTP